jgi:hypothetical protein
MLIRRHSENFTGLWKPDRVTFTISTQYFTQCLLYNKFNLTHTLKRILFDIPQNRSWFCHEVEICLALQLSLLYTIVLNKLRNGIWTVCIKGSSGAERTIGSVCA